MANYGATITIVNRTPFKLTLDNVSMTPLHGTWSIPPTNIPAGTKDFPSSIVFSVLPDNDNDNGSEGNVYYTIASGDRDKVKFQYNRNRTPTAAKVELHGQLTGFKVTTALTQEERNVANPLIDVLYLDVV